MRNRLQPNAFPLLLCALLLAHPSSARAQEQKSALSVTSNFEGGNAEVIAIDQNARAITIKPRALKIGWAYWWYMRVDGIVPGETLTLELRGKHGRFAHPEQAAFSTDQTTWKQTQPGKRDREFITYRITIDAKTAWFAWGPPFTPKDAHALIQRCAQAGPWAQAFELTQSRGGRTVPGLRITQTTDSNEPRYGIWFQARQHAWECGSSWVAEGLAEWLVSDHPQAVSLRKMADVTLIPIMDMDSVATGQSGKGQQPQDHNRDWSQNPYWPEVRAAKAQLERLNAQGKLDLFVDLHAPGMYNPGSFYLSSPEVTQSPIGKRNLNRFIATSEKNMVDPLPLNGKHKIADQGYTPHWKKMSQNWITALTPDHVVAVTLETAWNAPGATIPGYEAMGRQLGLAIERYLNQKPRVIATSPSPSN